MFYVNRQIRLKLEIGLDGRNVSLDRTHANVPPSQKIHASWALRPRAPRSRRNDDE